MVQTSQRLQTTPIESNFYPANPVSGTLNSVFIN